MTGQYDATHSNASCQWNKTSGCTTTILNINKFNSDVFFEVLLRCDFVGGRGINQWAKGTRAVDVIDQAAAAASFACREFISGPFRRRRQQTLKWRIRVGVVVVVDGRPRMARDGGNKFQRDNIG